MVLARHSILFRQPQWDVLAVRSGWAGVDLFFVLSGYLISGLLFSEYKKTGTISFRRFAARRALKIWPPFYVVVFFTIFWSLYRSHFSNLGATLWPVVNDVFFLQSYREGSWGHFWSLSVEEHFYILLPLTMFLMRRRAKSSGLRDPNPFKAFPALFAAVAVTLLIARLLTARYVVPFSWHTHLFPTHLRLDSLLFGALLSYFSRFHAETFNLFVRAHRLKIAVASAVLILPCLLIEQENPWMYTYGFTSLYLGFGGLLITMLHWRVEETNRPILALLRCLAYIGTFSYSIYLWHLPAYVLITNRSNWINASWTGLLVYYFACIAIGIVTAKAIEVPTLRLRERMVPSRPRPAAEQIATQPL